MTPSSLAIKLFVDWDCQDWAGTHDFSQSIDDISADVTKIRVTRSFDRQNLTYPAATLEMTLKNENGAVLPHEPGLALISEDPDLAAGQVANRLDAYRGGEPADRHL